MKKNKIIIKIDQKRQCYHTPEVVDYMKQYLGSGYDSVCNKSNKTFEEIIKTALMIDEEGFSRHRTHCQYQHNPHYIVSVFTKNGDNFPVELSQISNVGGKIYGYVRGSGQKCSFINCDGKDCQYIHLSNN